jgi:hypothetical protein
MMIRNRIVLKTFAVFFLIEIISSTVLPSLSWALTAGPTAPEATSFEPVDTTDLVNLSTGDLVYNVPLLEVPGPSGGYPLSLSYHPAIQPNEDASWVGLGWNLNPGAVLRNVSGIPDDFSDVESATRFYWNGGHRESFEAGVTIGPAGQAGVTAGLSYSQDTFQGSGVGISLGISGGIGGKGSGASAYADIGISPYGDPSASAGVSLSVPIGKAANEGMHVGIGMGISTNFKSVSGSMHGGVSYSDKGKDLTKDSDDNGLSLVGGSISTNSRGVSTSLGGNAVASHNAKTGKISTHDRGFSLSLPVAPILGVSLGYHYQRYWIDETDKIKVNGALMNAVPSPTTEYLDSHSFDNYSILEVDTDLKTDMDPEKQMGGTFPNYDNFYVHAQGVSGNIRPYYFEKFLVKRNDYVEKEDSDGDTYKQYKTYQYPLGDNYKRAEFRFVGDLSNRFEYNPEPIRMVPDAYYSQSNPMGFNFGWSNDLVKGELGNEPYASNTLAGSRHIEYLTNSDIAQADSPNSRASKSGFKETNSTGFNRNNQASYAIGAMIITNESGVKYHFSLPVMTFDEYTYAENVSKILTFNESKNPTGYAYTWLLTGVTGVDYIDRGPDGNPDGKLNEFDWGYWVSFEYGKWTDQYYWRNPSEDMSLDIDNQFKKFSEGRKELYYLDAIRTKSHTALFIKEIRDDAKSTIYSYRNISNVKPNVIYAGTKETLTDVSKNGGFIPKQITNTCNLETWFMETLEDKGNIQYYSRPTSTLKLNQVLLFTNDQLPASLNKSDGSIYQQQYNYDWTVTHHDAFPGNYPGCPFTPILFNQHLYQNVLDVGDVKFLPANYNQNVLRQIDFKTDYSLSPGTSNSFSSALASTELPSTNPADYPLNGKLTLKGVSFKGKGGADLIPGMNFNYELDEALSGTGNLQQVGSAFSMLQSNSGLSEGDIIKFSVNNAFYYAVVASISENGFTHNLKILGTALTISGLRSINWQVTKNPPYDKNAFDTWGLYKSDIDKNLLGINENAARLVSRTSARALDVWSLRSVSSSLGSKTIFDYGADEYRKPVLSLNHLLRVKELRPKSGSQNYEFVLYDNISDLDKLMAPSTSVGYSLLLAYPYLKLDFTNISKSFIHETKQGTTTITSIRFDGTYWILEVPNLSALFTPKPPSGDKTYAPPIVIAGNISHHNEYQNFGGGIRVNSITIESENTKHQTLYDYTENGKTSGVTSFEPGGMDQAIFVFPSTGDEKDYFLDTQKKTDAEKAYNTILSSNFSRILANSREILPPGVLYESVTVKEKVSKAGEEFIDVPNYSVYNFAGFNEGMIGIIYGDDKEHEYAQPIDLTNGKRRVHKIKSRSVKIKNYSAQAGLLKKVTLYHNSEKISETINHYLHDNVSQSLSANTDLYEDMVRSKFNGQGIIHETFAEARMVRQDYNVTYNAGFTFTDKAYNLLGVVAKREEYPIVQTGQTSVNYKTGIKTESENLALDFYTGTVISSKSSDGYGNTFVTETTPAYRVYDAMKPMGLGGKNMLTQQAATKTYKLNPSNLSEKQGLVSASVQTWSDQTNVVGGAPGNKQDGIWRMKSSYIWKGDDVSQLNADGLYPYSNFATQPFNFTTPDASSSQWQKTSEITLYDVHSHALEASDLNGDYAATKMSSDNHTVLATAANAGYNDLVYSGAEDNLVTGYFGGNVSPGQGVVQSTSAHTGLKSLLVNGGNTGFTYAVNKSDLKNKSSQYHASVWVKESAANVLPQVSLVAETNSNVVLASATPRATARAGSWYLINLDFDLPATELVKVYVKNTSASTSYAFDDFRFHPFSAAMTSYVYNQWGELTHILNNNNLYTEYRYDGMGRLKETYTETFRTSYGNQGIAKISEIEYNYGSSHPFNIAVTSSKTGPTGSIVPSGAVQVEQGKSVTFSIAETCQYPKLSSVTIDNVALNFVNDKAVLFDGTEVYRTGKIYTFKNVQSAHSIKANFYTPTGGVVECVYVEDSGGNRCYTGGYRYAMYNACEELQGWNYVQRWTDVPTSLKGQLSDPNCCHQNTDTGYQSCSCKPGSTLNEQ